MRKNHFGFSLIEIIVSLLILSLVLLGFDAMQIAAFRAHESAYYFSVAAQQINNLQEHLQITNTIDSHYLALWNEQNKQLLPNGFGSVERVYSHFKISIFWGNETRCDKNKIGLSGCIKME